MGKLMKKELKLAMHPTAPMFLALSAMLLIPNYPYYVIFFYTSLAVFFICLTGRENHDIFFTMLLPVSKKDVVKARFFMVILLEMLQLLIGIPFAMIRQSMTLPHNAVGMEANIALFGFAFVMLGLFNLVFFGMYYRNVDKVGKAFGVSGVVSFLYIGVVEALAHVVPFLRDKMDTFDDQFVMEKLVVLLTGFLVYIILTAIAYQRAVKHFEVQDL